MLEMPRYWHKVRRLLDIIYVIWCRSLDPPPHSCAYATIYRHHRICKPRVSSYSMFLDTKQARTSFLTGYGVHGVPPHTHPHTHTHIRQTGVVWGAAWWCPSANSVNCQPCDHTAPGTQRLGFS